MRLLAMAARKVATSRPRTTWAKTGVRPTRRGLLAAFGWAGLFGFREPAFAAPPTGVSDWVASSHSRVRLIDGGSHAGRLLAGLQIELDPTFLTYWRTPGEAGVAPTAAFDGSNNVASATLAYPAPQRFDEAGAEAFGYRDSVVFPIAVTPSDPARPVTVAVSLSFAVCSALCLPASAHVELALGSSHEGLEAGLVRDALRHVPVPLPLGSHGPLAVVAIESGSSPSTARVTVRAPVGSQPSLFAEAPDPWYVEAGPRQAIGDGRFAFDLKVLAGPKTPSPLGLTLTVTTDAAAVETIAHLENVAAPSP